MYRIIAAMGASLALSTPAAAQDVLDPAPAIPDVEVGDIITVGLGLFYGPDYEGSDEYRVIPGPAFRADLGDISIQSRGLELVADVIPDSDARIQFTAGPIVGVRLNRTGSVEDPIIDALPDRDVAVELGGFAGVSVTQLTNPYDALTFKVDVMADVAGAHDSTIVTPSIDFSTPLSLASFASLSVSAEFVGDGFADTYFSVTPAEALLVPELPIYDADGGLKNLAATLVGAYSLSGDIRSGWVLVGLASYSRLVGDFADSPIVADRGSADQWALGAGIGYSF